MATGTSCIVHVLIGLGSRSQAELQYQAQHCAVFASRSPLQEPEPLSLAPEMVNGKVGKLTEIADMMSPIRHPTYASFASGHGFCWISLPNIQYVLHLIHRINKLSLHNII